MDAATPRARPEGGQRFGGGGNRGGFNRQDVSEDTKNMRSGAIGSFAGKKIML